MFGLRTKANHSNSQTAGDALIREYAFVMETSKIAIDSIDRLPAPKPIMKVALVEAIRREKHSDRKRWLMEGYKFLAIFQNLSADEIAAVKLLSVSALPPSGSEQEREAIIAFMPVAQAYEDLQKRVQAEQIELALELRTAGIA